MAIMGADVAIAFASMLVFFVVALVMMDRTVAISIIAGAITGLLEGTIMFPLENLKIQQQLDGSGLRHALLRTIRHHGCIGLYRGLMPVLMGAVPTQAIRWGCFEGYCSLFDCRSLTHVGVAAVIAGIVNSLVTGVPIETMKIALIHSHVSMTKRSTSPSIAGGGGRLRSRHGAAVDGDRQMMPLGDAGETTALRIGTDSYTDIIVVQSPKDHISPTVSPVARANNFASIAMDRSPRLVSRERGNSHGQMSVSDCGLEEESVTAAEPERVPLDSELLHVSYRGWLPTVGKKILNQAIRFPAHSWALRTLCRIFVAADATNALCKHNHVVLNFAAGAFSGVSSIIVTQPLDVVKTRMQGLHGERYHGTMQSARLIVAEEGMGAFLQGLGVRMLRTSFGAGLTFAVFPYVQAFVGKYWP